jgi:hypothetical protein
VSYNATGSLARFENKNILFYYEKRSSLLQHWRCSCNLKSRILYLLDKIHNFANKYGEKIGVFAQNNASLFKQWTPFFSAKNRRK